MADTPQFTPLLLPPDGDRPQRAFYVIGTSVWEVSDPLDAPAQDGWPRHFLGVLDGVDCWAVDVPAGEDPADGAAVDLRRFHTSVTEAEWLVAGRGVQLVEWARTHRFCGRCGSPTEPSPGERAMRCPSCNLLAYPRVAPAMITLVTRGDPGPAQEALLARGKGWPLTMYSCLAGFVEPGENLEMAVRREVREEVGVDVGEVCYQGSQPWPFPHSLMVGFRAAYVGGELEPDPTEIADAKWVTRADLPDIPPSISIARRLIDTWLNE